MRTLSPRVGTGWAKLLMISLYDMGITMFLFLARLSAAVSGQSKRVFQ
jgi:hypothetical protein